MIVDPGLLNHIHKRLHSGEAREAIAVSLKNNGWEGVQIDEAFKQIEKSMALNQNHNHTYKTDANEITKDGPTERISSPQFIVGLLTTIIFMLFVFAATSYVSSIFPDSKEMRTFDFTIKFGGFLVFVFALFSLSYRRLHDLHRKGTWTWLILVPIVNIALLIYLFSPGQIGSNQYGPDPRKSPLISTLMHHSRA